jgi:hypothetical protein
MKVLLADDMLNRPKLEPHLSAMLSFRLVRNLFLFSEGFPTRFACGNDNAEVLHITFTHKQLIGAGHCKKK